MLPKTKIDTVPSLHAEALQATESEELVKSPYVAARAGFEPTTLRSKGIDSTHAPPRPTITANQLPVIGLHGNHYINIYEYIDTHAFVGLYRISIRIRMH